MQLTLTMVDTRSMIQVVLIVLSRVDSVMDDCDESTLFCYVFVQRLLRTYVPKNQTFLKHGGNSQKINSTHILRLGTPWCETNHDILRLAEYRFIHEKIDNNRTQFKRRFSCSKFKKNLEASRLKVKQPRPIKSIKS